MASVRPRTDGQILVAAPPFAEDYDKIVVCGNECAADCPPTGAESGPKGQPARTSDVTALLLLD
jgi:hypothetical protein